MVFWNDSGLSRRNCYACSRCGSPRTGVSALVRSSRHNRKVDSWRGSPESGVLARFRIFNWFIPQRGTLLNGNDSL
eukprot:4564588-Pyramimonas_sp.AAC.1